MKHIRIVGVCMAAAFIISAVAAAAASAEPEFLTKAVVAEESRPTPRKARFDSSPYLFILPFVVFCLALLLYPVMYSLTLSFRDATVETFVSGDMPFNGFTQYQASLADPVFWRALINTVLFAFFSILFQFTIGFLLALLCLLTGVGCFKGNLASQVGALYATGDNRRADAFQIYYIFVNAGVIISPLIASYPLVTLLLSRVFLSKEDLRPQLIAGVTATVCGVILLFVAK